MACHAHTLRVGASSAMDWLVDIHSIWRYAILVAGLGALIFSFMAATGARPWDALTERLSAIFPIVMDVQLLIGLGVWFLTSWPRADTYLAWIHPGLMIVAIGLAHAGRALSERAGDSSAKGRRAAIFFGASLLIVVIAIPFASWPV